MDIIFEIIFEILFEGTFELAKSKRIPVPLRILAAVLLVGVYGGIIFLIVWAGIGCFRTTEFNNGKILGVLLIITAAGLNVAVVWQFIKMFRHRN